jgi:transposase InsO family protein
VSHRRKRRRQPVPDPAVHEDLVQRRFTADAPDRLWCTDVTEPVQINLF